MAKTIRQGTGGARRDGNAKSDRPTLHDVAREAGVSVATVSNVVNGKFSLMAVETRKAVEDTIRSLKYRVNKNGRSLRSAQPMTVAFVVLDEVLAFLHDPYMAEVLSGFANSASESGYDPILLRIDPARIEQHSLFHTDEVQGIFVYSRGRSVDHHKALRRFATLSLPLISLEHGAPADLEDICLVQQDDFGGGVMLANHLVQSGAKRVLFVRPDIDWVSVITRDAGLSAVYESGRPGLKLDRLLVHQDFYDQQIGTGLADYLRANPMPDAIMGNNDQIAAACIKTLRHLGYEVPRDVAVTGYNGMDIFDVLPYRLTTVRSPAYDLGYRGGLELVQRLRNGTFRTREINLSVTLRPGETSPKGS